VELPVNNALKHIQALLASGAVPDAEAAAGELVRQAPQEPEAWFQLGMALLRGKKLAEAEGAFRQVVGLNPEDARTWNNLSVVLRLQGKAGEAEPCSRRAVKLQPAAAGHWLNLASSQFNQHKFAEAAENIRKAIEINPNDVLARNNLCIALLRQGKPAEAEEQARRAVELNATSGESWANLGECLITQRRWPDAANAYRQAADREPKNAAMWTRLGVAELYGQRFAEAAAALERSLALVPDEPVALVSYASLLAQCGQTQAGVAMLQLVLNRHPDFAPAWVAMGDALRLMGNIEQATAALRRALELAPKQFEVRYNLSLALAQQWSLVEAESLVREIIADEPGSATAWAQLGVVLHKQARHEEGLAALRHSLELEPSWERHSRLLFHQQYADDVTQQSLLTAHREWDELYAAPLAKSRAARPRPTNQTSVRAKRERPLRIGFVSEDFWLHPVGMFVLPVLEALDKSRCSVVCYSEGTVEDTLTARLRAAASEWRAIAGLTNDEVAAQIKQDQIDVLIDLGGHTSKRLIVFAQKPAPVQITWLGYVGTTGLTQMDFLLADRFHVRPEEEANYVERVLRMPHDFLCFQPPEYAPDVGPLPALASGQFTFGSFNNPAKLSHRTMDAWAEILRRAAGSRLFLKYGGLHQTETQERIRRQFSERGVAPERIIMEGRSRAHAEFLDRYNHVDLALDTLPYAGCMTTCESLWMGVPVVTYSGPTFAGRPSVSHLMNVGLEQFVARDAAAYVELAAGWASRINELASMRAGLREQVRRSPLCNAPAFARAFLDTLQNARNKASVPP
jgi:protein O-GlcNAc transferase